MTVISSGNVVVVMVVSWYTYRLRRLFACTDKPYVLWFIVCRTLEMFEVLPVVFEIRVSFTFIDVDGMVTGNDMVGVYHAK